MTTESNAPKVFSDDDDVAMEHKKRDLSWLVNNMDYVKKFCHLKKVRVKTFVDILFNQEDRVRDMLLLFHIKDYPIEEQKEFMRFLRKFHIFLDSDYEEFYTKIRKKFAIGV